MTLKKISACILTLCVLLSACIIPAWAQDEQWSVASPNGNIEMTAYLIDGQLKYTVSCGGQEVVYTSCAGIITTDCDFSNGLEFADMQSDKINESYTMPAGKANTYVNNCNELKLTFKKGSSQMDFYMRAYNDGAAFRYGLSNETEIIREVSSFNFGSSLTASVMEYERAYENPYKTVDMKALAGTYAMPFLVWRSPDLYALVFEADLNGSYCGSALTADGSGELKICFDPKQTTNVYAKNDFTSPWRAFAIGNADSIANTQMPENLNPPCAIDDTSWIVPGACAWTWYNGDPTDDPETYKKYIDFACEAGWKYILLDEGWQPRSVQITDKRSYEGVYDWAKEIIAYAAEKNIGILVWSTWWDLETPEQRTRLVEWAQMGIKGVKIDFFDSETQETLILMDTLTRECAELHLMVNYHGCNKPSGERRTYPNVVSKEAVYGTEHFLSGEGWGPTAEHNCILPFTRNAVGPMDHTPSLSTDMGKGFETDGQRCALAVVFESGVQVFSDKAEIYENSNAYDFFKNIPVSWDASRLISGVPGRYVTMLRQKGNSYYIGSICNEQYTEDIKADFLPAGKYKCEIYYDGENGIEKRVRAVENDDILTIANLYHGGTAIKLTPWYGEYFDDISSHWCREYVEAMEAAEKLNNYFYGTFEPDKPITRAEFVKMLLTAYDISISEGVSRFADSVNHFAKNDIYTATQIDIINGVSEYEFEPDSPILREQAAVIIGRKRNLSGSKNLGFDDKDDISPYAAEYIDACVKNGIIMGYEDNTLRPRNNITRGEAAAMILRSIEK